MEFNRDKLMQQAMLMQNQLEQIQKQLGDSLYKGNNGGKNGVSVTVNGNGRVQKVEIADELINADDKDILEDMIMLAANDALKKADDDRDQKMSGITGGLNIPGING